MELSLVFNFEEVKNAAKFAWYVETVTALNSQNEAKTNLIERSFGGSIPNKQRRVKVRLKSIFIAWKN